MALAGAASGAARSRTRRRDRPRRRGAVPLALIAPAASVYLVFVLAPLGRGVWLSFQQTDGITPGKWVGLRNYGEVFSDAALRQSLVHALVLVVFYCVLPVCLGLALTGLITGARLRGQAAIRAALFVPQVIPGVAIAVIWRWVYDPSGPLNAVLRAVGLRSVARGWLADFHFALPAVAIVGTWLMTGLCVLLFVAGVQKIPGDLYDAARVDGAGRLREFWSVTVPGLRGEILVAVILTMIAALRTFDLVYLMTGGGPGTATTVPSYQVYRRAFFTGEVGSAAALGVVLAMIILLLSSGAALVRQRLQR